MELTHIMSFVGMIRYRVMQVDRNTKEKDAYHRQQLRLNRLFQEQIHLVLINNNHTVH